MKMESIKPSKKKMLKKLLAKEKMKKKKEHHKKKMNHLKKQIPWKVCTWYIIKDTKVCRYVTNWLSISVLKELRWLKNDIQKLNRMLIEPLMHLVYRILLTFLKQIKYNVPKINVIYIINFSAYNLWIYKYI